MNYFNYLADQYLVSSVITAIATLFFTTVPEFRFNVNEYQSCQKKHFKCIREIKVDKLLSSIHG